MRRPGRLIFRVMLAAIFSAGFLRAAELVNDVTQLHPVTVERIVQPRTTADIVRTVRNTRGPVSIGGARHSQGGQIAEENSLHLDMRTFKRVLKFDPRRKEITVQSGITWREVQDVIDPANLAVSIMQSYANFTVGGSLSVNCHGRYVGEGPIISSVKSLRIVSADGRLITAAPAVNPDLFYAAIGGYGGVGVIAEATLALADNARVIRETEVMPIGRYRDFFFSRVRDSRNTVFHNGDIYPPGYDTVRSVTWRETAKPATIPAHLVPPHRDSWLERAKISFAAAAPFGIGKFVRQYLVDPLDDLSHPVKWRNYEASLDAEDLEPGSRKKATYVLQEYFVPLDRFDDFHPRMREIFRRHHVNVLNVSIRHARKDPGSLLAWAKTEVFALVIYYRQGTSPKERAAVGVWTKELIAAALAVDGSYYLPYQIWATPAQFRQAYPRAREFFAVKRRYDPRNKFRNKLWDAYDPSVKK